MRVFNKPSPLQETPAINQTYKRVCNIIQINMKKVIYLVTAILLVAWSITRKIVGVLGKPLRRLWGRLQLLFMETEMEGFDSKNVIPQPIYQLYRNY